MKNVITLGAGDNIARHDIDIIVKKDDICPIFFLHNKHVLKIALITLFLFTLLINNAAGQSVYVGRAGVQGKVLRKYIDPSALKKLVEQPADSIWIIDVRSEKAYLNGHIPTAKSFPYGTIMSRLNEIPKDNYLIIYCTISGLAKKASNNLKKAGYKRYINWGGISRWEWEKETGINK